MKNAVEQETCSEETKYSFLCDSHLPTLLLLFAAYLPSSSFYKLFNCKKLNGMITKNDGNVHNTINTDAKEAKIVRVLLQLSEATKELNKLIDTLTEYLKTAGCKRGNELTVSSSSPGKITSSAKNTLNTKITSNTNITPNAEIKSNTVSHFQPARTKSKDKENKENKNTEKNTEKIKYVTKIIHNWEKSLWKFKKNQMNYNILNEELSKEHPRMPRRLQPTTIQNEPLEELFIRQELSKEKLKCQVKIHKLRYEREREKINEIERQFKTFFEEETDSIVQKSIMNY